jgi:flavin reductase
VAQNLVIIFQFHAKHRVGQQFDHLAAHFQKFFFRQTLASSGWSSGFRVAHTRLTTKRKAVPDNRKTIDGASRRLHRVALFSSAGRKGGKETKVTEDEIKDGFRHAMRRLATTIALDHHGPAARNWTGMAATAVVSVCAEPPTLLAAVNRTASIHPLLHGRGALLRQPAGRAPPRSRRHLQRPEEGPTSASTTGGWVAGPDGLPVLADALASLVMPHRPATLDVGTHTLFIGEVEQVDQP